MGNKKGSVWSHWTVVREEDSHPTIRCNYCTKTYDRAASKRMQNHIDKCLKAPNSAKSQSKSQLKSQSRRRRKTTPIVTESDQPDTEQNSLESSLVKALSSTRVPFDFVDNPLVIQFFQRLQPSFNLPNKTRLDEVYEEVKMQDGQISDLTTLRIDSDDLSNIKKTYFILCTPKPFLFDATFSGEESHAGDWIANQIFRQIDIIGNQNISAVITDTTSVMEEIWKLIEGKHSNIECLGCNSHIINLLIGDILKIHEFENVLYNVKIIVNYFKYNVQAAEKLKYIQNEIYNEEIALILPQEDTYLSCFQSFQNSRFALNQALMDPLIRKNMDRAVRSYVLSEEFWETLAWLEKILIPMIMALKSVESDDTSTLSTVFSYFNEIIVRVNEISCVHIQQIVRNRLEDSFNPIMMVAFVLDPRFWEISKKRGCSDFMVFADRKFGREESLELLWELRNFRQKVAPYDNETIWMSCLELSPSEWWKSWPNSKLQQLAIKVLSIPVSSAAAERYWQ